MNTFLELLLNGILLGGVYALMACGLNLIFGVMRVINFAHGEFLTMGALATFSLCVTFKLPLGASTTSATAASMDRTSRQ